mmetsp:Transcript_97516/g.284715  ORF Transcript_97516/g.284715 Transcript_97516/m.284715 type:complete len:212 (+) Transcript_97516:68-703(+)
MIGVCSACKGNSDKQTDTVKISFVPPADAADKENAVPELACITTKEAEKAEEEARRRAAEEEQRRQEERQRLEAMEKRRREEEERRRQAEEAERRRLEEERLRRQREEEELARQQREEEEADKREQMTRFLGKNGFGSVNDKKKKGSFPLSGFTYPLHVAVKAADPKTVRVLLWAGADRNLKDSSKLTPLELARKLNKKGSQTDVIEALSA